MKVLTKYFDSEWSVSKIKVEEKLKTVGFDVKNHRLIIMTYDRSLYFVDIPLQQARYLEQADIRVVMSDYPAKTDVKVEEAKPEVKEKPKE